MIGSGKAVAIAAVTVIVAGAVLVAREAVDDASAADVVVPLGPQGVVPQFVVECEPSHAAPDDPIVRPGQPGMSHLHQFFGAT